MRRSKLLNKSQRGADSTLWLSFSDLMSSLVLIIILVLFYVMYQYFDMYESSMNRINEQRAQLETQRATLEEQTTQLETQRTQLETANADLEEANAQLETRVAQLEATEKELTGAQTELSKREEELTAAQAELKEKETSLQTLQTTLDEKESSLQTLQTTLDEKETALSTLQTELSEKETTLSTLQTELSDKETTLSTLQTELSDKETTLTTLQSELADKETTLTTLQTALTDQQTQLDAQQEQLQTQQKQLENLIGIKPKIIRSLSSSLQDKGISANVDPQTGALTLEADVLFNTGRSDLMEDGMKTIDSFLPVYLDVLFSDEYRPYLSQIIIEGHTDSDGTYISNLSLSQARACSVAEYVLRDGYSVIRPEQRMLLREYTSINGRSYSDRIFVDGKEDKDASRRVVFKFQLRDEEMVAEMQKILADANETGN